MKAYVFFTLLKHSYTENSQDRPTLQYSNFWNQVGSRVDSSVKKSRCTTALSHEDALKLWVHTD